MEKDTTATEARGREEQQQQRVTKLYMENRSFGVARNGL
jgi:hypothetical protein